MNTRASRFIVSVCKKKKEDIFFNKVYASIQKISKYFQKKKSKEKTNRYEEERDWVKAKPVNQELLNNGNSLYKLSY